MGEGTTLLRLQEVDLELARCNRSLEVLPQRDKVNQIKTALKGLSRDITRISGLRKDIEIEIADNREARAETERLVDEAQADVNESASDYRALAGLEHRLTDLAKRLEKLDFDHAALEVRLEELLEREQKAVGLRDGLERQEKAQVESFKTDANELLVRRKELKEERDALVAELPEELYDRYVAALKRFGGQAVERLEGNRPTACRVSLQPSSYADIKRKSGIIECPYCRRLLVLDDGEE